MRIQPHAARTASHKLAHWGKSSELRRHLEVFHKQSYTLVIEILWPVRIESHTSITILKISSREYFLLGYPIRLTVWKQLQAMSDLHIILWGMCLTLADASWLGNHSYISQSSQCLSTMIANQTPPPVRP